MRICRLRIRNLNSLSGEWVIDFEDPRYSEGLFAITGPTGSGKTTILDGICLALYGATPRLGKIASVNEILSRGAQDCLAEVLFQMGSRRFLAVWSQKKKRRGEGLMAYRHQLSELRDGEFQLLEEKAGQVPAQIESVCGMDFKQFIRTAILPQGDVAAFLKAKSTERALLLEGLSGTEIYGEISKKVHCRCREERASLLDLENRIEDLQLLSDQDYQNLLDSLKSCEDADRALRQEKEIVEGRLVWHRRHQSCLEAEAALVQSHAELAKAEQDFGPLDQKLLLGERAARLKDFWYPLEALCGQVEEMGQQLIELELKEADAKKELLEREEQERRSADHLKTLRDQFQDLIAHWAEVRSLDRSLAEGEQERQEMARDFQELSGQREDLQRQVQDQQRILQDLEAKRLDLERQKAERGNCQDLAAQMALLRQRAEIWRSYHVAEQRAQAQAEEHKKALASLDLQAEAAAARLAQAQALAENIGQALEAQRGDRVLAAQDFQRQAAEAELNLHRYKAEKKNLEELNLEKSDLSDRIERLRAQVQEDRQAFEAARSEALMALTHGSLTALRKELKEGVPCPLCGALHHPSPWLGDEPDQAGLKSKAQKAEALSEKVGLERGGHQQELQFLMAQQDAVEKSILQKEKQLAALEESIESSLKALEIPWGGSWDAGEALGNLEDLQRRRKTAEEKLKDLQDLCLNQQRALETLQVEKSSLDEKRSHEGDLLARSEAELSQALRNCAESRRVFMDSARPYLLEEPKLEELEEVLGNLEDLGRQSEELVTGLSNLKEELQQRDRELCRLSSDLAVIQEQWNQKSAAMEARAKKSRGQQKRREELLGAEDPDQEEVRWRQILEEAEEVHRENQQGHRSAQASCAALEGARKELLASLARSEAEKEKAQALFDGHLAGESFPDLSCWRASLLLEQELQDLRQRREALRRQRQDWEARRAELDRVREDLGSGPEETMEALESRAQEIEVSCRQGDERRGALKQKLLHQDELRARRAQFGEEQLRREVLCRRWERLEGLIGSSDGKKFRLYAQTLTFKRLIEQANRRLLEISGRYLLVPNSQDPLELDVQDLYRAGEIRSARNLSGGEAFLVSLALALGLSYNAQGLRVESLFLDEGFGSLDEESLATVMECLATLRQQGRQIGVISHVAALRERIEVQIQVCPDSRGWSSLKGPGCSRKDLGDL